MPILEEQHDYQHPVEGDEAWSASYYFKCYDPDVDVGLFTLVGIRPNEASMDVGADRNSKGVPRSEKPPVMTNPRWI
jgi:hypothetical protein